MLLNNYLRLREETLLPVLLIIFSFLVRIPIIIIFGDPTIENEWEPLLYNLINHKTLSFEQFDSFLLPNLLMPPLYAYYLYIFSFFNLEDQNFILLILFSQIVLASISVGVFYKINKLFFSKKISFYSSLLFSLFPIYLYACSQISSVSLTIFLALFFYYYFFKLTNSNKFTYIFLFAVIGGLLILLRREFVIIVILSSFYLFFYFKMSIKSVLLVLLISLITISPYLVRNYMIFEKIIIHSSFGFNLWKGNNRNSKVEGSFIVENALQNKINKISKNKFYRINFDKIFLDEAIKNIKETPGRYLVLYLKRTASYFFIDLESSKYNYYNPVHYLPIAFLGITSLIGIFLSDKKSYRLNYLIFILLFYIFVFSFFSIMPRYKLYIIPLQIIFTNIFINYVIKKYKR
tara:strand:- start:244 stop:1458 length:1215 start_codon:yes stop_codon:yes gene_type:complete